MRNTRAALPMFWSRLRSFWPTRELNAGTLGERCAEAHLRQAGFNLLARNWRNPADEREEIDLVMTDGSVLVFVEVKARRSTALVSGYFAVTKRKKRVLLRACEAYLRSLRPRPLTFRFDVVEVALPIGAEPPAVRHYANVPLFPKGLRFH